MDNEGHTGVIMKYKYHYLSKFCSNLKKSLLRLYQDLHFQTSLKRWLLTAFQEGGLQNTLKQIHFSTMLI